MTTYNNNGKRRVGVESETQGRKGDTAHKPTKHQEESDSEDCAAETSSGALFDIVGVIVFLPIVVALNERGRILGLFDGISFVGDEGELGLLDGHV